MTSYIDAGYYNNTFEGESVEDEQELSRMIKRASDAVDDVTGYKINHIGIANLSEFVLEQVKKATASQVEYYAFEGLEVATIGDDLTSVQLGRTSYSKGSTNNSGRSNSNGVSRAVIQYLKPTGLLYSGLSTVGGR